MMRSYAGAALGAIIFLASSPMAVYAADSVRLNSGWAVEGDITVETDSEVKVRVNGRTMTFPRASIAEVTYGPDSSAPSQVAKRAAEDQASLEANQEKVEVIKIKKKKKKKKTKEEPAKEVDAVGGGLNPDGTLVIPETSTPEEEKAIALLRSDKESDRMTGAGELRKLKSYFAISNLIRALDDKNVHVRKGALAALKHITHQSLGFNPEERNRSVRLESIKRWQKWYEKATGKKVPW